MTVNNRTKTEGEMWARGFENEKAEEYYNGTDSIVVCAWNRSDDTAWVSFDFGQNFDEYTKKEFESCLAEMQDEMERCMEEEEEDEEE